MKLTNKIAINSLSFHFYGNWIKPQIQPIEIKEQGQSLEELKQYTHVLADIIKKIGKFYLPSS